ncbi:glycoside hydrolase family 127 protein [Mucilaginibacter sp. BJC16-A38]|uniref:glycoside hydrolase family 127 protein n=1 Tax=Mucilaginibacter phenanthrenivorans TaxID=1234842 RepID=UPI0021587730|nr:glycoside hydrolase family 127 protein [Mucilaginibacter phenanthrenivorans]MCR8561777.1 glycoside hydrolase family 127 protein [Mucilaginibacter phenanthrenivorans]
MLKKLSLMVITCCWLAADAQKQDYPIQPVPFTSVKLTDHFWTSRIETNRTVTIPASFKRCDSTGRIKNFIMAAEHKGKFCTVYPFDDTDIYKTIEGASYSLAVHPDPKLSAYIDSLIAIVGRAQEPDGYLYTARSINPAHPISAAGPERWVNEGKMSHELYNCGHMFEAAAAHYMATGKRNFLNIALKNADLLVRTFGPDKKHVAPGHEIVEMGLVRLYRITGKTDYLTLAKFFIDQRGIKQYDKRSKNPYENGVYFQDNEPVVDQDEAEGHAVRAMYLYSGMTDVAALTGDTAYVKAIDKIWNNMVTKKMYVQGSIGAVGDGERFGDNYELPNATAYNETCAAIGSVFWNQRMFLLHGDSKYIDVMEKTLYNGLISGVGLDGNTFFYTNAMQVSDSFNYPDLERSRSGWFVCSCCPTNVARFLPSIPGYMYAQNGNDVYINLFISGTANLKVNNKILKITQQNNYPWDGGLAFTIDPAAAMEMNLKIRIPGWTQNQAIPSTLYSYEQSSAQKIEIKVNGKAVDYQLKNGYAVISKKWKKNDKVELTLPMDVQRVVANASLTDDSGKISLQRGPLMYCAEWKDNDGKASNIIVPKNTVFTATYQPDLLNGVTVLKGDVKSVDVNESAQTISTTNKTMTAIPYYSWANRGKGEMTVWFPEQVKYI